MDNIEYKMASKEEIMMPCGNGLSCDVTERYCKTEVKGFHYECGSCAVICSQDGMEGECARKCQVYRLQQQLNTVTEAFNELINNKTRSSVVELTNALPGWIVPTIVTLSITVVLLLIIIAYILYTRKSRNGRDLDSLCCSKNRVQDVTIRESEGERCLTDQAQLIVTPAGPSSTSDTGEVESHLHGPETSSMNDNPRYLPTYHRTSSNIVNIHGPNAENIPGSPGSSPQVSLLDDSALFRGVTGDILDRDLLHGATSTGQQSGAFPASIQSPMQIGTVNNHIKGLYPISNNGNAMGHPHSLQSSPIIQHERTVNGPSSSHQSTLTDDHSRPFTTPSQQGVSHSSVPLFLRSTSMPNDSRRLINEHQNSDYMHQQNYSRVPSSPQHAEQTTPCQSLFSLHSDPPTPELLPSHYSQLPFSRQAEDDPMRHLHLGSSHTAADHPMRHLGSSHTAADH